MNIRLSLAFVAVAASLASCVYSPPPPRHPKRPGTGVSLDKPASGERSARETRYLDEEAGQAPQNAPTTPADPNAPASTGDAAAVQAPSGTTPPPTTAETEKPKEATPPPAAAQPAANELPYGVPVPGKKGFVYSPYDKSAGFVDVRDIGPGTKVRCPYTGKIFRVP